MKTKTLNFKGIRNVFTIFFLSFFIFSCTDTETEIVKNNLDVESADLIFPSAASSQTVTFESSIPDEDLVITIASEGKEWCSAIITDQTIVISTKDNDTGKQRKTIVTITGKEHRQDISVGQQSIDLGGNKDILVKVDRVEATNEIIDESAPNDKDKNHLAIYMVDGDPFTFHNSEIGEIKDWPFYYDFYFKDVEVIDYIVHTPRQDAGNGWGAIGKFELWVATESEKELKKYGDYDFEEKISFSSIIKFDQSIEKPIQVQFRIMSAYQSRVSCGEMEFFQHSGIDEFDYTTIFTDASCSKLKEGITEAEINNVTDLFYKKLALSIFKGEYKTEFRASEHRPYQHPNIMAKINKTASYSLKDNATGIYVKEENQDFIVFVGDTKGQDIMLNIRDYVDGKEVSYPLYEGINILNPSITGLIYIYNHTNDEIPLVLKDEADKKAAAAKTVKINFYSGEINGVFDITKHDNAYWEKLLNEYATYEAIDVLGIHSHVAWIADHYREDGTDIVKMTNYIDEIVDQQKDFAGLYKYKKDFKNRQYIRYDHAVGAADASDYRTRYNPKGYRNVFTTEAGFRSRLWVLGHEVGHVNQVRPGVKWGGTTEITNNLYAMYNQKVILGEAERLTNPSSNDGYAKAFSAIIEANNFWFFPEEPNNHIPKVASFWQLYLYFVEIEGQEDFYRDLFEHFRTTPDLNQSGLGDSYHGMLQLDFIRQVCRVGNRNMLDFFDKWGYLKAVDTSINDYGSKRLVITQKQIDDFKAEINSKNYPKPTIEVHTLTDENYKSFIK